MLLDLAYLSRRAEQEAISAIAAADARAAAVHDQLCRHYCLLFQHLSSRYQAKKAIAR